MYPQTEAMFFMTFLVSALNNRNMSKGTLPDLVPCLFLCSFEILFQLWVIILVLEHLFFSIYLVVGPSEIFCQHWRKIRLKQATANQGPWNGTGLWIQFDIVDKPCNYNIMRHTLAPKDIFQKAYCERVKWWMHFPLQHDLKTVLIQ